MKFNRLSRDSLGTGITILLSQGLRPFIGYPVADILSFFISLNEKSPVFQALKLNLWVASGKKMNARELRKAARQVLRNQGRTLYDFYHNLDRPDAICRKVKFSPKFAELVKDCKKEERATLLVIPHLAGFNIGGLAMPLVGFKFLTLSYPNPGKGYEWQNEIRNERGMEVEPMSITALRHARERFERGGTVLTGIDRPVEESNYHPQFFGQPSNLPVAHFKLALQNNARVFVVGFLTLPRGKYLIDVSDEVILEADEDQQREMEKNAEKALLEAEKFIRHEPNQWMMFYPVWPDLADEVPQ